MPIFVKHNRRIYFAHLPKTGGTSIYLAFAQAGWSIFNVAERSQPHTVFQMLRTNYNIQSIPKMGFYFRYPHSIQHAPSVIWRTWGPFEESFAVIRDPVKRFISAIQYHYRHSQAIKEAHESEKDFLNYILFLLTNRPFAKYRYLDGHLMPQANFLLKSTLLFDFQSDWAKQIEDRYALKQGSIKRVNSTENRSISLSPDQEKMLCRQYRNDYSLFKRVSKKNCL